uniref:Sugar phosphate transporter domain-containing protein n=1 Tax=Rhodosorus marinus TaxID=101924 RepID=A0A7S0BQY2_9RHOD|mmetsp:Transcript_5376/g.7492  ORF Transcript_5376/g.7492 Transcript_5376/m.7492 type:complete len:370 (+) Transcript_5376:318-1427(+)
MKAIEKFSGLGSGNFYVPLVVFSYGCSSLSGVFVNKACLSAFGFGYPLALLLLQLIVAVVLVNVLDYLELVEIHKKPFKELTFLFIPATLLILNVSVGLYALKLVNIPMFSAFRRLSAINVMILEYFVLGKVESTRVIATVVFMVFGSFVAALGDVTFDPFGYFLVFLNNLITGGNLVYIKKAQQVTGLKALSLFYYVSLFAVPICFVLGLLSGELRVAVGRVVSDESLHSAGFVVALSLSALSAFMVNYTTNLCTAATSALTTAITGQVKNVLQTILGIVAWGYEVTITNLIGLLLALIGSTLFAWVKYNENSKSETPVATENENLTKTEEEADVVGVEQGARKNPSSMSPLSRGTDPQEESSPVKSV